MVFPFLAKKLPVAELEHDHKELSGLIDHIQAAAQSPSFDLAGFERDLRAVKQLIFPHMLHEENLMAPENMRKYFSLQEMQQLGL